MYLPFPVFGHPLPGMDTMAASYWIMSLLPESKSQLMALEMQVSLIVALSYPSNGSSLGSLEQGIFPSLPTAGSFTSHQKTRAVELHLSAAVPSPQNGGVEAPVPFYEYCLHRY